MTDRTDASAETPNPQLKGIEGWLILPAIGFIVGPLITALGLGASLQRWSAVARAGYGELFTIDLLVQTGLLVFVIYAAILFFGKKRDAPSAIIVLIIVGLALNGLLLTLDLGAGAVDFAIAHGKQLLLGLLSAAVWIPYFTVSKRVGATFVNTREPREVDEPAPTAFRPAPPGETTCTTCGTIFAHHTYLNDVPGIGFLCTNCTQARRRLGQPAAAPTTGYPTVE